VRSHATTAVELHAYPGNPHAAQDGLSASERAIQRPPVVDRPERTTQAGEERVNQFVDKGREEWLGGVVGTGGSRAGRGGVHPHAAERRLRQ
jgi:hypothetical protein